MAKDAMLKHLKSGEDLKNLYITYDEANALQNLVGQDFKTKV